MRLHLHDPSVLTATTSSSCNPTSQILIVLCTTQHCKPLLLHVPHTLSMNAATYLQLLDYIEVDDPVRIC